METTFQLSTPDGYTLYGTHNSVKSSKALVLVHGLTGYQYEQHYTRAVAFFTEAGFDVIRFDAYSSLPNARRLLDSSIQVQANDLDGVMAYFSSKFEELHVAGHSLGAAVILEADQLPITSLTMWDPTNGAGSIEELADKGCRFEPAIGQYIFDSLGRDILLGQAMIDSWIGVSDIAAYAAKATKPVKFIFAGLEDKKDSWIPHVDDTSGSSVYVTIDGATHGFVEEGALESVYAETLDWIEKH